MKIGKYDINKTLSEIIKDGLSIKLHRDSYLISYPEFLKYFTNLKTIDSHNLIIGINFTYGWMPTIFEFKSNEIQQATVLLNYVKRGEIPTEKDLLLLKSLFNNSMVGTSKILHFINPNLIPIWDSRVYRYLIGKKATQNSIGDPKNFLDYIKICNELINQTDFQKLKILIEKQVGYEMTSLRVVELVMYFNGK